MANTKVSDLTAIVTPVDADEIHVAQSGSSLKITLLQLAQYIDHGNLAGLSDDDHTLYSLADGTRAFTGVVAGIDPVGSSDLVTKSYVDAVVASDIAFSSSTGGIGATDVAAALIELQDEILDIQDITDHGLMSGLGDDDHTQYILADGTRDFSNKVIGVDPTSDQHLATKSYVDSVDADSISFGSTTGGISSTNVGDALRELQDDITDHFSGIIVTAGSLVITSGSITDTSGAISFGNENLSTTGLIGVGAVADLGVGIHIKSGESGASISTFADELIIESSGPGGITIATGNTSVGSIHFADSGDTSLGSIRYDHNVNTLGIYVNDAQSLHIDSAQNLGVGVTTLLGRMHVDQSGSTKAIPTLVLDQADVSEEFIHFIGAEGIGNVVEDVASKILTTTKFIRMNINGTPLYLQVGTIA